MKKQTKKPTAASELFTQCYSQNNSGFSKSRANNLSIWKALLPTSVFIGMND